jgi:hypothetical protein
MKRHPYFDLLMHNDRELASLLGDDICERSTLHEWPLSCVQRLTTCEGRNVIYKTQFGPTVEPDFYAKARSELLVSAETVYRSDGYVSMLIEYVPNPTLADLKPSAEQAMRIGHTVLQKIDEISGDLPVFLELTSADKWTALVEGTLQQITALVEQGGFSAIEPDQMRCVRHWAYSEATMTALRLRPGYIHGDLNASNLFVLPDGYRVIDWQRTKRGPTDLDLAALMESLGFDPYVHVDVSIVRMMYFLRINWFTQCTLRWFPEGRKNYEQSIANLASLICDA